MAMKVRVLLSSVIVLAAMSLASCGHYTCSTTFGNSTCTPGSGGVTQGGGTGVSQTAFVYYMDDGAGEMSAEGLDVANSQAFLPLSGFVSPHLAIATDGGIAIVGESLLYMPLLNTNALYGFSIDGTTGALTPVSALSPYTVGSPTSIAADPNGAVLFVGGSAGISSFTISSTDGSLTFVNSATTTGTPTQLVTDGLGRFVYAITGSTISAFSYTQTGVLTAVPGSPFISSGMAQIASESTGNFLLGITAEAGFSGGNIDKSIYAFGIGTSGALTQLATTTTLYSPVYIAVSPIGPFVYTFNENPNTGVTLPDPMEGYQISTSGSLTPLSTSPFTLLPASIGKFDQSGQYVFVDAVVAGVGGAFAFAADTSTGALTSTLPHLGFPSTSFAVTDAP
jgi:6-phosphogluconolactonase (cycloisomerase 2 family)